MGYKLTQISKAKYTDYFILIARFLIGFTFIRYGYSKLIDGQFGLSEAELMMPVKDLSLFKLSWYLFDHEPFKTCTGVLQLICGLLLIYNRTVLLGAFMFLPIVFTILLIDLSFMPPFMAKSFAWRLSFYIVLDLFILWHYKDRMQIIWKAISKQVTTKFKYPIWMYLILPIMAIGLELVGILPKFIIEFITNPERAIESMRKLIALVLEAF